MRCDARMLAGALGMMLGAVAPAAHAQKSVIGRLDIGFEHVTGAASGDLDLQGNDPGANLRESTQFLDIGLALGTRGLGYGPLNSYLLGQLRLDLGGEPGVDETIGHPTVLHSYPDARLFALHLAYAELAGFGTQGALQHLHLRAGRQFHWGGPLGITFDGATFGYDDGTLAVAVRGGRRAAVYDEIQDDPGVLAGLDVAYAVGGKQGLTLRGEYLFFTRELTLTDRDAAQLTGGEDTVDYTVQLAEVGAYWDATRDVLLSLRASLVAPELSHLRAGLRWAFGRSALLVDVDQKIGRDLTYDIAAGRGIERSDRRTTYEVLRLNIPDRQPYTDAQAVLELELADGFVLVPEAGVRVVQADDEVRTPYDADQARWGLGGYYDVPFDPQQGLELQVRYGGTRYDRAGDAHFADPAAGAERVAHEMSGAVRYARGRRRVGNRILGTRIFSAGVNAYQEIWVLGNRFIDDTDELAGGIGLDARWTFTEWTAVRASYEFARDSTVFARWVEPFHAVRLELQGTL